MTAARAGATSGRIHWIDNLRTVVIFLVVLYHVGGVDAPDGLCDHTGQRRAPHFRAFAWPDNQMVVLRPTRKPAMLLPATELRTRTSDTALGDLYVDRIIFVRRIRQ